MSGARGRERGDGERAEPPPFEVLGHDNHVLVVVKPAGLLAQADRTGDPDLLSLAKEWVRREYAKPGRVYLGLVHRIDRPASGVMVLARTSKAAARLAAQFRGRKPVKRYLAIVEGAWTGDGTLVDALLKEGRRVRAVDPGTPGAREAVLEARTLGRKHGLSLLELVLRSGRPHQARVQLARRGHPILGDLKYGARAELDGRNIALHAHCLVFEHPVRREPLAWSAPPPASWGTRFEAEIRRAVAECAAEVRPGPAD